MEARRPRDKCVGALLDLIELEGSELVISDYKSGWLQARTLDIRNDAQLRAYALAGARYAAGIGLPFTSVSVRILHVSEETIRVDWADVDALELGIVRRQMIDRFERLENPTAPNPGQHCKRCPVFTSCPAMRAGVEHALQRMNRLPVVRDIDEVQDADHAAFTRSLGKFLEEEGARLQSIAKQWVIERNDKRPIEIGPNTMYGPVLTNGNETLTLDAKGAVDVVRKHLGEGPAWSASVEFVATKASLEKGAKLIAAERSRDEGGKRVTVKAVLEPILEELRSVGALRRGAPIEKMTEFPKAKQQQEHAP
jgi:hypothetical protein